MAYEDNARGPVYGGGFSFAGQLPTPQAFLKAGTTSQAIEGAACCGDPREVSAATAEYDLLIVTNDANTFCEFASHPQEWSDRHEMHFERVRRTNGWKIPIGAATARQQHRT